MNKKATKMQWAESDSIKNTVRNFQSNMNSGSSIGGKLDGSLPASNRKERRIMESWKRKKKNENL